MEGRRRRASRPGHAHLVRIAPRIAQFELGDAGPLARCPVRNVEAEARAARRDAAVVGNGDEQIGIGRHADHPVGQLAVAGGPTGAGRNAAHVGPVAVGVELLARSRVAGDGTVDHRRRAFAAVRVRRGRAALKRRSVSAAPIASACGRPSSARHRAWQREWRKPPRPARQPSSRWRPSGLRGDERRSSLSLCSVVIDWTPRTPETWPLGRERGSLGQGLRFAKPDARRTSVVSVHAIRFG